MEKFKITIPKMALVKTSLSTHYSNSHHLQFMFNVYALVKAGDKVKLHLTDELLKSWADCIDMETELNKVANATLHAEQMAALDRQRDTLLTNLFGVIRVQQKSPVQALWPSQLESSTRPLRFIWAFRVRQLMPKRPKCVGC